MSFVWDSLSWLWDAFWKSLGFGNKTGRLLVLGLDNAGKTTLLRSLQTGGSIRTVPPTDRPHLHEEIKIAGVKFSCWDLGGHEAVRYLWRDYYCNNNNNNDDLMAVADEEEDAGDDTSTTAISAIVFVVDAADSERIEEAGYELDALIHDIKAMKVPLLVLFNKCDLEQALPNDDIMQKMEMQRLEKEHTGPLQVFRISVLEQTGFAPAFQWVARSMTK